MGNYAVVNKKKVNLLRNVDVDWKKRGKGKSRKKSGKQSGGCLWGKKRNRGAERRKNHRNG